LDRIACNLLSDYSSFKIFLFTGDLGIGKTALIKAICKRLEVVDVVTSPTYALIHEYLRKNGECIYHFDFYRIENSSEISDLGCEEYFNSNQYCLVEWPEKIQKLLAKKFVKVYLSYSESENMRLITAKPNR